MGAAPAGQFCWLDLAATDAPRAIEFYGGLFGWRAHTARANGGSFVRLTHEGHDTGSLYSLRDVELAAGVRSHWTPYVRVDDAQDACRRAKALGGTVAVEPFVVEGVARIAIVIDAVGAPFGVWEEVAD
jgi:predicted enzyme related to lactoylglutathione lyase